MKFFFTNNVSIADIIAFFIPIIVIPQIFFSGLIPIESMPSWLRNIGYIFPLSYAGEVLSNVMIKGEGLSSIWINLCVLVLFIIGFTALNIIGLKRYRKV
ncbi:ABC transporter permease [Vagococcus sp. JNUCC 83]